MYYDIIIFDDDCDVHFPDHFRWRAGKETTLIGYGCPRSVQQHPSSSNFILRRIFKLIYTIGKLRNKNQQILVYDDIICFGILSLFTPNSVSLRLTHLKDYERMSAFYRTMIYKMLAMFSRANDVFVISQLARRYLKQKFDVRSKVITSMVDRDAFNANETFNGILVYSGTISGRNILPSLESITRYSCSYLKVNHLIVMAPRISSRERNAIVSTLQNLVSIEIIASAAPNTIKDVYARADFGIAFYDVFYNRVLKQNFPLKTLEYLASNVVPIGNEIPAHRELMREGFVFIKLDNRSNVINGDQDFDAAQAKIVNRTLSVRLDQYFKINAK